MSYSFLVDEATFSTGTEDLTDLVSMRMAQMLWTFLELFPSIDPWQMKDKFRKVREMWARINKKM